MEKRMTNTLRKTRAAGSGFSAAGARERLIVAGLAVALFAAPVCAGGLAGQEARSYPGVAASTALPPSPEGDAQDGGIVQGVPPAAPAQSPDPSAAPVVSVREPRQTPPPQARVGVDESNPMPLRLTEAIEMALIRNRDIEVERINAQQAGFDVEAARGFYDPVLRSTNFYESRTVPVASFLGGGENGSLTTKTFSNDVTVQKALPTGGFFEVGATSARNDTNNVFSAVNPEWQSGLTFTFRQPLLRNRGIDENRRRLLVARRRLDQTDAQFRQRVIETIGEVQRGYWNLEFSLRSLQVAREAVQLAETQLGRTRRLVDQGINAPVDLVQVEAELERRREEELSAVEGVTFAENTLKSLILSQRNDSEWNRPILPADTASVSDVTLTLGDAVPQAIANRPELASLRAQREINEIDVKFFRGQKRPQVDFFATYGLTGLAGTQTTGGNPFSGSNELLRSRINELSAELGFEPLPPSPPQTIPGNLIGGAGQGLQNLFSNDYRTVRVGVDIGWSINNRTAEANLGRSEAEGRKIDVQRQALEQRVEREVRNALQAVQTARQRVDTARAAREAAEVQLQSEQRRQEAGLTTTFFVLTRQNELSSARARELRALTDYNNAVVDLQRVLGTTLTVNAVDVKAVKGAEVNEE
jgi:outer membrane protein TolC